MIRTMTIALALAMASSAHAAEKQAVFDGGAYAGLSVGYTSQVLGAEDVDLGAAGAFVGGYAGFGGTLNSVYLGLEGDIALSDVKANFGDGEATARAENGYIASLRGRVGIPVGPALFYLTAGPAFTQAKISVEDAEFSGADKKLLIGIAAGGGVEAELTRTVLIRIEGLHYAFPAENFSIGEETLKLDQRETVFRIGIGFKLN